MRSLLVQGELGAVDLAGVLPAIGITVQNSVGYSIGNTRVVLYVGRKFYFRSNDYLGIVVLTATTENSQRIDLNYAGGGSGMMGVQWGAGRDLETTLFDAIVAALVARSLAYSEIPPTASG